MINVLDDQVGEIIDKIHELGIAENTLIYLPQIMARIWREEQIPTISTVTVP